MGYQTFTKSEPEAEKRILRLFPTTDGVTGKETGVAGQTGCEISMNEDAFVATTNTPVQYTGPSSPYPIYRVQLTVDEVATLGTGVVIWKDPLSVWFAAIFEVSNQTDTVNLDQIKADLTYMKALLRRIYVELRKPEEERQAKPEFRSPL